MWKLRQDLDRFTRLPVLHFKKDLELRCAMKRLAYLNRRSIQLTEETDVVHIAIQPKKEPPYSGMNLDKPNPATDKMCSHLLVMQKSIRFLISEDQIHPRFSGWIAATQLHQPESKKTTMTYLLPILLQSQSTIQ